MRMLVLVPILMIPMSSFAQELPSKLSDDDLKSTYLTCYRRASVKYATPVNDYCASVSAEMDRRKPLVQQGKK